MKEKFCILFIKSEKRNQIKMGSCCSIQTILNIRSSPFRRSSIVAGKVAKAEIMIILI